MRQSRAAVRAGGDGAAMPRPRAFATPWLSLCHCVLPAPRVPTAASVRWVAPRIRPARASVPRGPLDGCLTAAPSGRGSCHPCPADPGPLEGMDVHKAGPRKQSAVPCQALGTMVCTQPAAPKSEVPSAWRSPGARPRSQHHPHPGAACGLNPALIP